MASIPPGDPSRDVVHPADRDPERDRARRPRRDATVPVVTFVLAAIVVLLIVLL
jgi:hypothetical protein